jgi:hypothetical protein
MIRYAFIGGTIFGMALGWAFHGVISMAVRFGVVFVLLLPLTLLAFMWWRSSRERSRMQATMTVMRWNGGQFSAHGGEAGSSPYGHIGFEGGDVINLNDAGTREQQR